MSVINDQWSACRAVVKKPNSSAKVDLGGEDGRISSSDIIAGTITKDLRNPAASFSLSLKPSQEYLDRIETDDWIEIYLTNGTESREEPVLFGLVDSVRKRKVVGSKGEEVEVITVAGRDWGKVLTDTELLFEPLFQSAFSALTYTSYATYSTKEYVPKSGSLIKFLINQFLGGRRQFLLPNGETFSDFLDTSRVDEETLGYIFFVGSLNLNGSLWGLLSNYTVPFLHEFYTDWDNLEIGGFLVPQLVYRQFPFSRSDFANLDSLRLLASDVIEEDIGKSSHEVVNWFRVYADWAGRVESGVSDGLRLGYANPSSYRRHGIKRLTPTTNGLFPVSEQNSKFADLDDTLGALKTATQNIAEWHCLDDQKLSGSMVCRLLPKAKVGTRVDFTNAYSGEDLSFYCEGVNHSFSYHGQSVSNTVLQLTRGVPSSLTSLLTFEELVSSKILFPLEDLSSFVVPD